MWGEIHAGSASNVIPARATLTGTVRAVEPQSRALMLAEVKRVTEASDSDLVEHASGDTVMIGDIPIELIHTPGHTPGSQCFFVDGRLVSGDTLFLEGCGRLDLPGGDAHAMYESLTQKLAKIPDDAVLFPGHQYSMDPSASMGETRQTNYVFRPKTAEQWLMMFGN